MTTILPENIADELYSDKLGRLLTDLAVNYDLSASQVLKLSGMVHQIYEGALPPKQLVSTLQAECLVDDRLALRITDNLRSSFFDAHKAFLAELYRGNGGYFQDTTQNKLKPRETTPQLDGNIVNLRGW